LLEEIDECRLLPKKQYRYQRLKQAIRPACLPVPACLRQAQAVIFKPGTSQAGQAKSLRRPGRLLKIHRPRPACDAFASFK